MSKQSVARIILKTFLKTIGIIVLFIGVGVLGYYLTMLYLKQTARVERSSHAPAFFCLCPVGFRHFFIISVLMLSTLPVMGFSTRLVVNFLLNILLLRASTMPYCAA